MKLGAFSVEQVDALCLHHLRGGMKPREIRRVLDVSVRRVQMGIGRARKREKLGVRVIPPTPDNIAAAIAYVTSHPKAEPPPQIAATPLYGCKPFTPRTDCGDIHPGRPIPEGSSCYCESCHRHGMDGLHRAVPLGVRPLPKDARPAPPAVAKFKPKLRRGRIRA